MRDPNRIGKFCDRLACAWRTMPDQRFGQFILNCLGDMASGGQDPFFPEDDEMIEFIEEYVADRSNQYGFANNHIENIRGGD